MFVEDCFRLFVPPIRESLLVSLAEHFRDSRETEDMLRSIAANERGKEIIQQATALPTRSVDARAHLQSFLATSATDKS